MSFIKFGSLSIHDHGDDASVKVWAAVPHDVRHEVAQNIAGDEWRVVSAKQVSDNIETVQRDLRRIMAELGMSLHARTESSHDVVIREVLPRIRELKATEPDRPPTIEPGDVRVGDLVEIGHCGEVVYVGQNHMEIRGAETGQRIYYTVDDTTVRLVRRAEPEPDPEQVEALVDLLTGIVTEDDDPRSLARALVRQGVTVRKEH